MMPKDQILILYQERVQNKNSYERCDFEAVAEKQWFNPLRTKLPTPVI